MVTSSSQLWTNSMIAKTRSCKQVNLLSFNELVGFIIEFILSISIEKICLNALSFLFEKIAKTVEILIFSGYHNNYISEQKGIAMESQNRLYTSWYNSKGLQCKVVGPSTKCFCDHLYKYHKTTNNKVKCAEPGCKCAEYYYLPIYGSQDFKCNCKHSYQAHDTNKRTCKSCPCKSFSSNWSCSCGQKFSQHKTVSESKQAKEAKGQTIHGSQGGIISYSSMLDGADRFEAGIKQEIKKKGIKVRIQDFNIHEGGEVLGQIACWDLYNSKLQL